MRKNNGPRRRSRKKIRLVVAGFQHGHIFDLLERAKLLPGIEIAGTCDVAGGLAAEKGLKVEWNDFGAMLENVGCDAVAIGSCYGERGKMVLEALRAGLHVIADKPLCTSLEELEEIEAAVRSGGCRVGIMFDLRDRANFRTLRDVVRSGRIGSVQTVSFLAQHPLLYGARPRWYFKPQLHGGTINDIAVHAMDLIPWLTGVEIERTEFSRAWNAKAAEVPSFKDCGLLALRLSNGGGVIGDVSYLAPDGCGYRTDLYWRVSVFGTGGVAETSFNSGYVSVADDGASNPERVELCEARPGGYLEDFLDDVRGIVKPGRLSTASCLRATRLALECEAA